MFFCRRIWFAQRRDSYLKPRLMINIHFGRGKILYSKNDKYIKI